MNTVQVQAFRDQAARNVRKRVLFEKWLTLGRVKVNFDATHVEVVLPPKVKGDHDMWLCVLSADIYTSHFEGLAQPPRGEPFQFQVPWDAVHALFSLDLNERHIYLDDVQRAVRRQENRKAAKAGKVLPS